MALPQYPEIAQHSFTDVELVNPRKLSDPGWRPDLQSAHRRVNLNFAGISLVGQANVKKLEKILYVADRELEIVAEYCDATVVPHEWVLLEDDTRIGLAAKVQRIYPDANTTPSDKVQSGVDRYNKMRRWLPWGLADIACRQFVSGSIEPSSDCIDILCDIDPLSRRPMSLV